MKLVMPNFSIHTIDLNFLDTPQAIASFAVFGPQGATIVETGPGSTLPALLEGLRALGIRPSDVRDVLVTHIHLDHAGASGWWAKQGATIHVHAAGAPHLIDPSKLLASAARIYGDQLETLWGEVLACAPERVHRVNDGEVVTAAGLEFTAIQSPGHARHHQCWKLGDIAFAGDAAAVRLPGATWIALPAPPPEFDPEAWQDSLNRLSTFNFRLLYATHFGAIEDEPTAHLKRVGTVIAECAEFVRLRMAEGVGREAIVEQYSAWQDELAAAAAVDAATFKSYGKANNRAMSVDGIMRYWSKRLPGE